jgi:hypothetical protein
MARGVRSVKPSTLALGCDHPPAEADPYRCRDCLTGGDACAFHAGFAEGWDGAMTAVMQWVCRDAA